MNRRTTLAAVIALTALSFYLRALPSVWVFQNNFVNFSETDAWFHIRSIDHLVRNFPHGLGIDPYFAFGNTQLPPAGPFFDWPIAAIAWLAGAGHPSELLVHKLAAWYPAVLGALLVPVIFLLGRAVFGLYAGLLAAAVAATLPGHFMDVGSVGYTDHHVMESLLSATVLLLLVRCLERPASISRAVACGLVLSAYLLTFVGGAFLVAIIVAWAAYDKISVRLSYWIFGVAALPLLPYYRVLWMPYSIAALLGGALFLSLGRRYAIALTAILIAVGWKTGLASILIRLAPSSWGRSGGVAELQPLLFSQGWNQFAGAYVLSIIAVILLAELCIRRPQAPRDLIFFFGLATFLLAAAQVRMTYYFGTAAALFSGFLGAKFLTPGRPLLKTALAAIILIALLFYPNISTAIESSDHRRGVSDDWRESLDWLRANTPEPFQNPAFFDPRYSEPIRPSYSVMSWWDYGYWISSIAHRVPVSNPTQANAAAAATFYLAQSESEALVLLDKWQSRYVFANQELPLSTDGENTTGMFLNFFEYDHAHQPDEYVIVAQQTDANGVTHHRYLFRPAYYRSMIVRLFIFGGEAVGHPTGAALAYLRNKELTDLRRFDSEEEALAAEPKCRDQGCVLVSESPALSCVRLEALTHFQKVYSSSTQVLKNTASVQIYEVRENIPGYVRN